MKQLLLHGMMVDDLLGDWSKYCRAHGMELGALPGGDAQQVTVVSDGRECCLNIASPDGADAEQTLRRYLDNLCQRRLDLTLTEPATAEEARDLCADDENVAFFLELGAA